MACVRLDLQSIRFTCVTKEGGGWLATVDSQGWVMTEKVQELGILGGQKSYLNIQENDF